MIKFRLIVDPPLNGAVNMAKDHAILEGMSMPGAIPVLRFYRWEKPSVTLGYFQKINECVNTSFCAKNGIPVIRRETGGGTVIHHMELTYSFTAPAASGVVPSSVEDSFRVIIAPVIKSLRGMSLDAEYRPVNDIVVRDRKISGSAQIRRKGVLQQHGTLIMDMDNELITSVLIHDEDKLNRRGFKSPHDYVTSIRGETGWEINEQLLDELIQSLVSDFAGEFNIEYCIEGLTETECIIMDACSRKFSSDEWNFKK